MKIKEIEEELEKKSVLYIALSESIFTITLYIYTLSVN
jgi:hypothetical protein